jgi:hypothetical protein
MRKLTPRQKALLEEAVRRGGGITASLISGVTWRTFSQLERRGLLRYMPTGKHYVTAAGREALENSN